MYNFITLSLIDIITVISDIAVQLINTSIYSIISNIYDSFGNLRISIFCFNF